MKYICKKCGEPTDNDQSFFVKPICNNEEHKIEVHRCDKCDKRFHQELDWESDGETYDEKTIICPYCECEYEDCESWDFEDSEDEVECLYCGRKFDLEIKVRRTYSTKRSLCEMPENYGEDGEEE